MSARTYRKALDVEYRRFQANDISREQFDIRSAVLWEQYLVRKHRADGDDNIFRKLIHEAKDKYAVAKDDYYLTRINITEYIWRRGLRTGQGIGWYDYKCVELGLGTDPLPVKDRETFSWRSLKVEREIFPDNLRSPDNLRNCPPENEKAAAETMRIFLELIDFYNQNYIPSLGRNWQIRDQSWIAVPEEQAAYDLPYLDVVLTRAEVAQFERWRDGIVIGVRP